MALGAALALACTSSGALAQDAGTANDGSAGEIFVEAPRSASLPRERSPYTGAPIVTSTVRIPVLYGDLDLTRPGDDERLFTRVESVAHDVCEELDRLQPFNPDADCVSKAVASGTASAKAVIAAAQAAQ
jgi:UrcA family protein